jgi:hypothetical protein
MFLSDSSSPHSYVHIRNHDTMAIRIIYQVHESDVRHGLTLEDSHVFGNRDDFFNIHSTLLVVMHCENVGGASSCIVINPHVETGRLDTTYVAANVPVCKQR